MEILKSGKIFASIGGRKYSKIKKVFLLKVNF